MVGLYGKLPAHGDFISRNVTSGFINAWDEWLQRFLASSQEHLGGEWLDIYLTSPIWRFALSPGVIDEHVWAGVLIPSVDRVGRYFPFSVVSRLHPSVNTVELINNESHWFSKQEALVLRALEGTMVVDELFSELQLIAPPAASAYRKNQQADAWHISPSEIGTLMRSVAVNMDFEEQMPSSVYPYLLNWFIATSFPSHSVWHTSGSERVQPSFLLCQGLPSTSGATAMLDGGWQRWTWQSPYILAPQGMSDTPTL